MAKDLDSISNNRVTISNSEACIQHGIGSVLSLHLEAWEFEIRPQLVRPDNRKKCAVCVDRNEMLCKKQGLFAPDSFFISCSAGVIQGLIFPMHSTATNRHTLNLHSGSGREYNHSWWLWDYVLVVCEGRKGLWVRVGVGGMLQYNRRWNEAGDSGVVCTNLSHFPEMPFSHEDHCPSSGTSPCGNIICIYLQWWHFTAVSTGVRPSVREHGRQWPDPGMCWCLVLQLY